MTLDLDPTPFRTPITTDYTGPWGRSATEDENHSIFDPRDGYEQDATRYGRDSAENWWQTAW